MVNNNDAAGLLEIAADAFFENIRQRHVRRSRKEHIITYCEGLLYPWSMGLLYIYIYLPTLMVDFQGSSCKVDIPFVPWILWVRNGWCKSTHQGHGCGFSSFLGGLACLESHMASSLITAPGKRYTACINGSCFIEGPSVLSCNFLYKLHNLCAYRSYRLNKQSATLPQTNSKKPLKIGWGPQKKR